MLARRMAIAWLVGCFVGVASGRRLPAQNIESPVEVIEGFEPVTLRIGDHTVGAAIDTIGDIDRYDFFGEVGDVLNLNVAVLESQELLLRVLGPDGVEVAAGGNAAANGGDFTVPVNVTKRGAFSVVIHENPNDEMGLYVLQIERLPPLLTRPALHRLYYGASSYADTIIPECDTDWFVFHGIKDTEVQLRLNVLGSWEARLDIRSQAGDLLKESSCLSSNGCDFPTSFTVPATATYFVSVKEGQFDEPAGGYNLNLQCLSGPCPPVDQAVYQIVDAGPNCVDLRLINNVPVRGGEVSIGYPSSLVSIKSITALRPGMPAAIEDDEIDFVTEIPLTGCAGVAGVDRGLTINWLDRDGGDVVIQPGRQELIRICFTPKAGTTNASCPDLKFLSCLGPAPTPVENLVTDRLGGTVIAQTVDARTCLRVNTNFRRGDVNGDTRYDVSDAISLLICQFLKVGCTSCLVSSDANDDNVVDVSDAIYLLNWRFHNGAAPKAPFPNCGADPTPPATPAEICVETACL